jgi:uncharacterized protein YbbC (DUF1343 family)
MKQNTVIPTVISIIISPLCLNTISSSTENKTGLQTSNTYCLDSISRPVIVGADRLFTEFSHLINGKKIALVTNHTGRLKNGKHLADALFEYPDANLIVLFGMHFNIRTNDYSLHKDEESDTDFGTGLPKHSLYGTIHKPTAEMLKNVEVIIFDIQEVGARFYEHVNILGFVMEAAAENNIEVVVLDRPNPITGIKMDGFVTDNEFLFTFGAYGKIPVIHGLTMGELARLYNETGMLRNGVHAKLHVIVMIGWKRSMWFDQTGLEWIKPSPNLLTPESILAYTGTCLFEGLNISTGRGTKRPFEYVGAPWINNLKVVSLLNDLGLNGVVFDTITFTPVKMPFLSRDPYLVGELCKGIFVNVTDKESFEPYKAGISMVWAIYKLHADNMEWDYATMNRLVGTQRLVKMIQNGNHPRDIFSSWEKELSEFKEISRKYWIY